MNSRNKLLIISNSPLSHSRANGKTILSYFDALPRENVRQLYFLKEVPSMSGYKYFQITDEDVIRGLFNSKLRGRSYDEVEDRELSSYSYRSDRVKGDIFRCVRELLWWKKWKSQSLINWLDEFSPTAVFFVGGDSGFAYEICKFVVKRYNCRLSLYVTDDYIMPRSRQSLAGKIRRQYIKKKMKKCARAADCFFTISSPMQKEYEHLFEVESDLIVNIPERVKEVNRKENDSNKCTFIYAGSLYYGREDSLQMIAKAINQYNNSSKSIQAKLEIYSSLTPDDKLKSKIEIQGSSAYCGSLTSEQLKAKMNEADVLVFVESFNPIQVEKTRFSLSTKIPEYLSAEKSILAVGPENVGSLIYLADVAACVNNENKIDEVISRLIESREYREELARCAYNKYLERHCKQKVQPPFIKKVFGSNCDVECVHD